jgi:hypothetical protein
VQFLSEPQMFNAQGTEAGFVCMTDPDGTVIELLQT